MVNTQKMAELIAEKASLTAGDVHNVIRNLMSVMREQLLNSRTVRLEGLGTFTMIAKAGGKGVELESKVSSSQITSLRCQSVSYTHLKSADNEYSLTLNLKYLGDNSLKISGNYSGTFTVYDTTIPNEYRLGADGAPVTIQSVVVDKTGADISVIYLSLIHISSIEATPDTILFASPRNE